MKICVSSTGNSMEAQLDPRFGRCLYFVIVDPETMQFEAVPNVASGTTAGRHSSSSNNGRQKVQVVITVMSDLTPFKLSTAGIEIITGASGTVKAVIEQHKRGELRKRCSYSWRTFWHGRRRGGGQ